LRAKPVPLNALLSERESTTTIPQRKGVRKWKRTPVTMANSADTFASPPEQEQSILILRLVLDLTDSEIGEALGLSRSAVQRRRTKSLNTLRAKLTARKGG
jgi:DNA-directed RNA polymerase specialized sigma24 family protein